MNDPNKINIDDLPFFARFLENQMAELPEVEAEDVVGGMKISKDPAIQKYPIGVTNRYPSDREDGLPVHPPSTIETAKFPSDSEDSHGSPRPSLMTKKYPSDFEETFHH